MRTALVLSLLLFVSAPLAAQSGYTYTSAESCGPNRVPLLILGTYHMANPGLDSHNLDADDVLAPKRQKELEEVTAKIARFAPTKIAIEGAYRETTWTSRYEKYRAGTYQLGTNEIEQIGFRLAKMLGHTQVYPVDFPMMMSGLLYSEVDFNVKKKKTEKEEKPAAPPALSEEDRILRASTVAQYLARMNEDARVIASNRPYMEMLKPDDNVAIYESADSVANWYKRNLRIFANVNRITDFSKDRVLLIIGSGHLPILRQFTSDSPQFCLVNPMQYLQ
jgi:hypothetical protein